MGAVCVARKAAQGVFSFVCLFVFPFAIFISCLHFLFLAMGNSFCAVLSAACLLQRCRCEFSIAGYAIKSNILLQNVKVNET